MLYYAFTIFRDEDSSNDIIQVLTNPTQPESDESNIENSTHTTKQIYDKNCQSKLNELPKEQTEVKNCPSKRDLTKEWVQIEGLGRCSLDLIAVICYTKLHTILGEKINYRNKFLTHRITSYLGELVYKGATKYRNRGHIKRIKLPNCKVLKTSPFPLETQRGKLPIEELHTSANNSDTSGDEQPTSTTSIALLHKPKRAKFRVTKNLSNSTRSTQTEISCLGERENICIEFIPRDDTTFKAVQSIAQNPYLRIFASPSTFFADISNLISSKWKKLFSRSGDLTMDFYFQYSNSPTTNYQSSSNLFIQENYTIRDILINQINISTEQMDMEPPIIRLNYNFCTDYDQVLSDGIGGQISPLTALVQLLRTINKSDKKHSKIPIGKDFPRKFVSTRDKVDSVRKENTKNVITRSLLKNKLEKLRQMHASKLPLSSNSILKIEQLKKLTNRPNSNGLKHLVEYLRSNNNKNTMDIPPNKRIQKSNVNKSTFTRSVPSSFHSVLKEKATSRSLFSSEVIETPNTSLLNYEFSQRNDMQRWVDELSIGNTEPANQDLYFGGTNNPDYLPELPGGTFSMLADAYFGVDGNNGSPERTEFLSDNFEPNCPSVVSENFQSLLSELDGMVQEWDADEVYNTDIESPAVDTDPVLIPCNSLPNPAKVFLKYFLSSHEANSEDNVMRSIFEDDSLDSLGSQQFNNIHDNDSAERNTM